MQNRLAMGVLALTAAGLLGVVAPAEAVVVPVLGYLHGSNEVPPVSPGAGAFGWISCNVDVDVQRASCTVTFYNVPGGIILSHFHAGQNGANGPVVCDATGSTPLQASNDGRYTWTCDSTTFRANGGAGVRSMNDLIEALVSGMLYFNIHTNEHTGGEIRGQVCPVLGTGEHNPVTGAEVCSYPR